MQYPMELDNFLNSAFYGSFGASLVMFFLGIPLGLILLAIILLSKKEKIRRRLQPWLIFCFISGPILWLVAIFIIVISYLFMSLGKIPSDAIYY